MNKQDDRVSINTLTAIDLEKSFKKKQIVRKVSIEVRVVKWLAYSGQTERENYMFLHDPRNNPSRQR